ncbi:MAG: hypothetical protein EBU70_12380, partial [Actinobacteria bacterium]|nr:hypothetical protein [Actinomycetota bacterium]
MGRRPRLPPGGEADPRVDRAAGARAARAGARAVSDAVHARRPAPGEGRLTVDDVVRYVRHPWALELSAQVREALVANAAVAEAAVERGEAYGRTTGVGANRDTVVESGDGDHGLRLVRSHAAGAGPDLGGDVARATMLVRAHQLSLPGSGVPVEV